jgi:hypothetical protein
VRALIVLLSTLLCQSLPGIAWGQPFTMTDLRVNGIVISVIPAELRRPQRHDLIVVSRTGTFPKEARWISVFWQQEGGRFNQHPDLVWEMDPLATAVDVGTVGTGRDRPSIVYLTSSEVRAYHLTGATQPQSETLLKVPTMTAFPDLASLPRFPLVGDWKGTGQSWLRVPQFGQLLFYLLGQAGPQAPPESINFQQSALLFGAEREYRLLRDYGLQLIYRLPLFSLRDFDGDGRADLIATWQDHLSVYLQDGAGRFPQEPSHTFNFNLRTEQETRRRSVFVSSLVEDLDGDGRVDLVLSKMTGRLTDRHLSTAVYLNHRGSLATTPNVRLEHDGFGTTLTVKDLNGDGKLDLLLPLVRLGVKNIIRNLLSDRVEVSLMAHLYRQQGLYNRIPDWERNFPYQVDMSDGVMLRGVWPNVDSDFDGDGKADLLVAGNDALTVYLSAPETLFAREAAARIPVKTSSRLMTQDLTGNGHADIVLWYEGASEWTGLVKVFINTTKGW